MKILTAGLSVDAFFAGLAAATRRALLLDFDGTIAPFTAERARARPYPAVQAELAQLLAAGATRVAVVSGRAARDVAPLVGVSPAPEIWGSHGLERLEPGGAYQARPASAGMRDRVAAAAEWIEDAGFSALLERKPFGVALHARGVDPDAFGRAREAVIRRWDPELRAAGLEPLDFDGGIEWRPAGGHKGEVVETVLAQEGPGASVAYLGDDRTDEDAFTALKGHGLGVLVRPRPRPTAADLWLAPPDELVAFLARWRRSEA